MARILYICRLYSGFEESLKTGVWTPKGAPTIAKMIEHLDASGEHELHIILTQKGESDTAYPERLKLDGLDTEIRVLKGQGHLPEWLWKFREKLNDVCQLSRIIAAYSSIKPDIVYCDRVNILPAAILARFTNARVIWRVMGVLEQMHEALSDTSWRSAMTKWLWHSPFRAVICTLEGSGGGPWMDKTLSPQTRRHLLLNGVNKDLIAEPVKGLPKDGVKMLFVGRLESLKGTEEFMAAFYEVAETREDLHAVVAGDGSLKEQLIKQAAEKGYGTRVHFLGSITPGQLKTVRMECDFYVSLNKQGNLSNVNLEALSDHLPAIIPSSDPQSGVDKDTDDLIPDDVFYRFGRVGDQAALVKAIDYMMDKKNRDACKKAAEKIADDILPTWGVRVRQELEIYDNLEPYDKAVVIADLGSGGAQKVAVSLIKELAKKGQKISVITIKGEEEDFHTLPENVARSTLEHCNIHKGLRANLCRIHTLRRALKETGARQVISFIAPTNILSVWACIGLNSRLIISERNDPARQSFGKMWDGLRKISYRFADVVTANSENAIESMKPYVPQSKLQYTPNALAKPPALPKAKEKIVLIVGRLHPQKAHHVLLNAFAKTRADYSEWKLVIAGDGPLRAELETQAEALNIADAVEFKGVISDPYALYKKAAIFVLPSLHEGTPNALLEAMSCACAPIVSDACEGAMPYIEQEKSGLVFPVGDAEKLANALAHLMKTPETCKNIGKSAQKQVEPLYSQTTSQLWQKVWEENVQR